MAIDSLNVTIKSQVRINSQSTTEGPRTVALSVLDAATARYTPTQAFWLFNPPQKGSRPYSIQDLETGLRNAIKAYPQWTGSLHWSLYRAGGNHTERFNRMQIQWGYPEDAGLEFVVAESQLSIGCLVPDAEERHRQPWDPQVFPHKELLSPTKLSLYDQSTWAGLPMVTIQITRFQGDGGIAIGVKMAHPIADAETMMTFMKDWMRTTKTAISKSDYTPLPPCPFEPSLISQRASGDIDAPFSDPVFEARAKDLPLLRLDWWAPTREIPEWAKRAAQIPPELEKGPVAPYGRPIPWGTWNQTSQCGNLLLHFTKEKIDGIRKAAQITSPLRIQKIQITVHIAILAHIWQALILARSQIHDDRVDTSSLESTLTLSLSVRPRVEPPLPRSFLGSPLAQASATIPTKSVCENTVINRDATLQGISLALATSVAAFSNPLTVSAFLHNLHFQDSPQRYWDCFLGESHVISTSWCRTGFYEVDFWGEHGGGLRYAQPIMETVDGIVVLYEADSLSSVKAERRTDHWTDAGVDVLVSARVDVLKALKEGNALGSFRQ